MDMQSKGFVWRNDFLTSIKPLLYTSKLIGLTPFNYRDYCVSKKRKIDTYITTSPWWIVHSLVILLGLSCAFIPHLKFKITHIHVHYSFSFVIFDVIGFVFLFLASIVSLIQQAIISREKIKASLLTIVRIDTHLLRICYEDVYKKTNIILVSQLVISSAYFLILFSFDFVTYRKSFGWFHCFIRYVINVLDVVMSLQFVNVIFLIGHRFRMLNCELKNTVKAFPFYASESISGIAPNYNISLIELDPKNKIRREKRTSKMAPDGIITHTNFFTNHWIDRHVRNKSVLNVRTLRRIHLLLHSVITTVNSSFGIQIMLTIISSATATTLNIHASIVLLTKDLGAIVKDTMSKVLTLNLAWAIPAIIRVIVITASCEVSRKEARHTTVLVQKLLLHRRLDPELLAELQLFSQQLLHIDTNFTASGFFTLDFSFLYSIIGSIATFLVFLTQVWESYGLHTYMST
jgi:hypothetical protein